MNNTFIYQNDEGEFMCDYYDIDSNPDNHMFMFNYTDGFLKFKNKLSKSFLCVMNNRIIPMKYNPKFCDFIEEGN